ncbi:MAG: hypothetical protein Q4G68_11005 [Planctomycetia bacterium]|nr:hypothetical protein [Planctomycetia bacterium]
MKLREDLFVVYLILIYCCFHTTIAFCNPNIKNIEEGIKSSVSSYSGCEFTLSSEMKKSGEETLRSKETIRLHFPNTGPSWKYWVQYTQDKFDQQWIINRFEVTNVNESRMFSHVEEAEGKWSKGSLIPWYVWDDHQDCIFMNFLGLDTIGVSLLKFDVTDRLHEQIVARIKYEFKRQGSLDGYKTYIYAGRDETFGVEDELHVIAEPKFMVVYYSSKGIRENFTFEYKVETIKAFDNVLYPAKGVFKQNGIKNSQDIEYSYEVTAMSHFNENVLSAWFPEWPPSTIIGDEKMGRNVTIEPDERQVRKVAKNWETTSAKHYKSHFVTRTILLTAGFVLVIYALYTKSRRVKK